MLFDYFTFFYSIFLEENAELSDFLKGFSKTLGEL
jgi:hypothetical protein